MGLGSSTAMSNVLSEEKRQDAWRQSVFTADPHRTWGRCNSERSSLSTLVSPSLRISAHREREDRSIVNAQIGPS